MLGDDVLVICKQCGGKAKAIEFVLDPNFKQMVCPNCVKQKNNPKKPENTPKPEKPAGWDKEDELLEKLYKKKKVVPELKEGMKIKCKKCNYVFVYSGRRMCPYCNSGF